jgi:flavin reductase (DIM6/NTAB) family NADH-FMN oxidoreductase RutF
MVATGDLLGIRTVDSSDFRRFAGCFPTGVAVVTTLGPEGDIRGATMNSVTSLSTEPPTYLMCFGAASNTLSAILQRRSFCINFLSAHQQGLSRLFASSIPGKAADVSFHMGSGGVPILDDVVAACEGRLVTAYDCADHTIAIGEIDRVHVTGGEPLVFYRGQYTELKAV